MSDATARAEQARRLLEDPLLAEAFAGVVKEAMADWANTRPDAVETREGLWRMVQTVSRVKNALLNHMVTGQMAEKPTVTRV